MKRLLSAFLAVLLYASPALAAFASVGALGKTSSTSSGTTLVLNPAATCNAGNLCVCTIAADNVTTTDGNSTDFTGFTDSGGNTWTHREFTNGQAGAGNGVTNIMGWTRATSDITITTGNITGTWGTSITAKAIGCWEFTVGAAVGLAAGGSGVGFRDTATDAGEAPSMALGTLPSKEYLFIRNEAHESNSTVLQCWSAVSTSFTQMETQAANTGSSATSVGTCGEFRILTDTGATSDPGDSGANLDRASMFIALEEVTAATSRSRPIFFP